MSARFIIGIAAFCVAISAVLIGNLITVAMIGEINRKREEGKTLSYFGFTPYKTLQIQREYRNYYPDGKLHRWWLWSIAICTLGMLGFALCMHILG